MSIYKVSSYGKTRYRVRYRLPGNPNPKTRTFDREKDAAAFEAALTLSKRDGSPAPSTRTAQTLEAFGLEYVEKYGRLELAPTTLANQRQMWNKHILPGLGGYTLRTLVEHPDLIQGFKAELMDAGVGDGAVSKALAVLSAVLGKAVEWNRIPRNPALVVKKPPNKRQRPVEAFSPDLVEELRDKMPTELDRRLISLLAYSGLRPEEALALQTDDIRSQTILVSKAMVDGQESPTKTRRNRSVRLLKPLADDLACCAPGLLFPRPDKKPWRAHDYKNWRNRVWKPAVAAIRLGQLEVTGNGRTKRQTYAGPRPYDLRHSFISLLLAAQENPVVVAKEVGNSPKVLLDVYAHVIADFAGQTAIDPEAEISLARRKRAGVTTVSEATDA